MFVVILMYKIDQVSLQKCKTSKSGGSVEFTSGWVSMIGRS